jgi:hypothetical protein
VIPAILAAPIAESVAGSVLGTVGGAISGLFSSPSSSSTSAASFAPMLRQAATQAHAAALNSPMGTMTSIDMAGMSDTDLRTWMIGLTGKQVQAVDSQGHTVSGIVEGYSQTGGTIGLNVNGHLLSLSNLSQITWSPAISNR